jgi:hypothetical protein
LFQLGEDRIILDGEINSDSPVLHENRIEIVLPHQDRLKPAIKEDDRLGAVTEDRLEPAAMEQEPSEPVMGNTEQGRLEPVIMDSGESVLNVSCSSCSDLSAVEQALAEAEAKIAKLLKVKEKLVAIEVCTICFVMMQRIGIGDCYFS